MPCSHFPASDHRVFPALCFRTVPKLSRNAGHWRSRLCPGSSSLHTPPSGSSPQDTQPSFHPAPFPGFAGQTAAKNGHGFSSLSRDPLCFSPKLYLLLCFSPPLLALLPCPKWTLLSIPVRLWSPLYCHDTKSRETEHRKELSFPPAPQLWEKTLSG